MGEGRILAQRSGADAGRPTRPRARPSFRPREGPPGSGPDARRALGIHVVDVRVKRADLPAEVQAGVLARMQPERQRIALRYRAEGEEKGREIRPRPSPLIRILSFPNIRIPVPIG